MGKPRQLCYLGNLSVDTAMFIITNIQANYSDKKDNRYLIDIVRNTEQRLKFNELIISRMSADTGYSNGENYKYLEDNRYSANMLAKQAEKILNKVNEFYIESTIKGE